MEQTLFRDYFEREVEYLWQRLRRLTGRYRRLEALYARNADSRVSRLVQSAAFAFAHVHTRLYDDNQRLVRPVVAGALPECLRPRPASTILQLAQSTQDGGAVFYGQVGDVDIPFELMWPVPVHSIELSDVWLERAHASLQMLRMTLKGAADVSLGTVLPDVLRVFVRLERPALALDLIQAVRTSTSRIRAKGYDSKGKCTVDTKLPLGTLKWVRVDTSERPLIEAPCDRFESSTLLRDLYAFPESFCFFDLDLAPLQDGTLERLELKMPLARVLDEPAMVTAENILLACGPATNQYRTPIAAIEVDRSDGSWPIAIADRPHSEILHVRSLHRSDPHDATGYRELVSWEVPPSPHAYEPGVVYFLLEQEIDPNDRRTALSVSFAVSGGSETNVQDFRVGGEVLADDGELAGRLGLGEIGRARGATNVARVAPARPARLGENHAWRINAYARMPPARFVSSSYLHEFFRLHDTSDTRDEGARIQLPRFHGVAHAREHRVRAGMLEWGDAFSVDLDSVDATVGEAWLLGELLSRGIAERNELLRFSTLTVRRGKEPPTEFSARQGARLPFPLG
jgi:type VI protein secretion system component VasA